MSDEGPLRLILRLDPEGDDPDVVDDATRDLLMDLREQPVESAELATGGASPAGTKSAELALVGSIAIKVLPEFIAPLLEWVARRTSHRRGAAVQFEGMIAGHILKFDGPCTEFARLIESIPMQPGQAPPPGGPAPA